MSYDIKAVYRDAAGHEFSAPVVRTDSGWRLLTANGERQVDYFIPDKDVAGGVLTFEDYSIRTKENLRGCDFIQKVNAIRSLLPWPTKPSNPPSVQAEPDDSRLRVERLPGESNLTALQRAYSEKEIAAQRKARQQARNQAQSATVDPRKVQQFRNTNNYLAAKLRPKRSTGE